MKTIVNNWIQLTLIAVVTFLVVRNYKGAAAVIRATGSSYGTAVNALQGVRVR